MKPGSGVKAKFARRSLVRWTGDPYRVFRVTAGRENAENERPEGYVYRLLGESGDVHFWIPEAELSAAPRRRQFTLKAVG